MISIVTFITGFIFLSIVQPTSDAGIFGCVTAVIVVFSMAFALDLRRSKIFREFGLAIFCGYLFRIVIIYLSVYGKQIIQFPNDGADTLSFYYGAVNYYKSGDPGRGGIFSKIMGVIFSFTGDSYLWGQFIVAMFSIVAILVFVLILKQLDISNKASIITAWIICLLPNFAILSSIFSRESIVCMFITMSIYCFIVWMNRKNSICFLLSILLALIGSAFHSGSIAIVGGYIIVLLLYNSNSKTYKLDVKRIIAVLCVIAIMLFLFIVLKSELFGKFIKITSLENIANTNMSGETSYARWVGDSSSVLNIAIYTIPRIFFFLSSPLPFQWRSPTDIIAFMFSSLFYLIAIWNGLKIVIEKKEYSQRCVGIALMIIMFVTAFVFGWGVSNAGTAARHRDKLVMLFGVLLALGISKITKTKRGYSDV